MCFCLACYSQEEVCFLSASAPGHGSGAGVSRW
uniref:Uncharacterized protein n=1 Tax=Anguilla anguilla TaxID=7936 RepID=A0A0E9R579_ANGAN